MKNIAFLVSKSDIGGAQKWVKEQASICEGLFNVYVVSNEVGWLTRSIPDGVDVYCDAAIDTRFSIFFIFRLAAYLRRNNIDVVVASSASAGLYSRLAALLSSSRCIYVSHGWSAIYNGGFFKFGYVLIERLLSRITDAVLCVSVKDFEDAKKIIGIKDEKLSIISNKILPMARKTEGRFLHYPPKAVMVSRFLHPKRPDLAINAFKDVAVELHFIGDGPGFDRAKELAIGCSNIYFKGAVEDFDDFRGYDFFVLLSDSEGTPMSALEAMSAGLPLLLSDVGGCSALIAGNGVLVKNDIGAVKDAIRDILSNYVSYGERSWRIFDDEYNLLANRSEYIQLYRRYI